MDELITRVQLHQYSKTRKYAHGRPSPPSTLFATSDIILTVNYNCGSQGLRERRGGWTKPCGSRIHPGDDI